MAPVVGVIGALVATKVGAFVVAAVINIGISALSRALAPKAPRPRPIFELEYSGTVEPARIIYGEVKASGLNVLPPVVTGARGEFLHQVVALARHEVTAINDTYFNQEVIESTDLDSAGEVRAGTYNLKAYVRKYLGTTTQTADTLLMEALPTAWTSDFRGRGIPYVYLRYKYDSEVYKNGKPEVSFIVQGRSCYDPRLDTSPGANVTDTAYSAYTTNPALCLADYLIADFGLDEDATRIDWDAVVTAADICDETVLTPDGSQSRYTCNVIFNAAVNPTDFEEHISMLAKAMMGVCYYSGGKWRMDAGAWSAPAFDLTDSDLCGEMQIETAPPRKGSKVYNFVRGRYVDPARNYQLVEFRPISNSTYETEDGGQRIPLEVEFPCCNNEYEAQRNAILLSRQSRRKKTLSAVYKFGEAFKIRPFDTGYVTHDELNFDQQLMRCISWRFRSEPAIELVLQEAGPEDFEDPDVEDYIEPDEIGSLISNDYVPERCYALGMIPQVNGFLIQWKMDPTVVPGIVTSIKQSDDPLGSANAMRISVTGDTQAFIPRVSTDTTYIWIQAEPPGAPARASLQEPPTEGLPCYALEVTTTLSAYAVPSSATAYVFESSTAVTQDVEVSVAGGTPPYTYAWTWLSGGAGISINAPSSAITSFTSTGLTVGESRGGTARCTITDDASAETTVDVLVSTLNIAFVF